MAILRKLKEKIEKLIISPEEEENFSGGALSEESEESVSKGGVFFQEEDETSSVSSLSPSEIEQSLYPNLESHTQYLDGDARSSSISFEDKKNEESLNREETRDEKGENGEKAVLNERDLSRSAYPEEFKKIYSLENVDVHTIQHMKSGREKERAYHNYFPLEGEQGLFDFGRGFREWMDSPYLKEPIQVLHLQPYIENSLVNNGRRILQDLIYCKQSDLLRVKGLGQGHFDELQIALKEYLQGLQLYHVRKVDFGSFLRCILGNMERKQAHCFLSVYSLSQQLRLSPEEFATLRSWSKEERDKASREVFSLLKSDWHSSFLHDFLRETAESFVVPWMRRRFGIVSKNNIMERLLAISEDKVLSKSVFHIMGDVYFDGGFILQGKLEEIDPEIYCTDPLCARNYKMVLRVAKSYFYKRGLYYPLEELKRFILQEGARQWVFLDEGFLEKALRISPLFRVRKNFEKKLIINRT